MTISRSEPLTINPGVTVKWQKVFNTFPYADGFTRAFYTISGSAGNATITGTYADGLFTFELTAALNTLAKGTYRLAGFVQSGADGDADMERYPIYNMPLIVTEGLAAAVTTDTRDQYQRELELINTAIENYVTDPVEEATAAGKSYRRPSIMTLQKLRQQLLAMIRMENRKLNAANGRRVGGRILANLSQY